MRKIIRDCICQSCSKSMLFYCLYFLGQMLNAQSSYSTKAGQCLYQFNVECPVYRCDITGRKTDSVYNIAAIKSKFKIIDIKGDLVIFRFVEFKKHKEISNPKDIDGDYLSFKYYCITRAQLDFKCEVLPSDNISFTVGSTVMPYKLRLNPFDFSKDMTLGSNFGIKSKIGNDPKQYISLLIGFNTSLVTLDSFNTYGKIRNRVDVLAFTPSCGMVFEFGNTQVGIFSGLDLFSERNQVYADWRYKRKPWLAFGMGFSVLNYDLKK